MSEHGAFCTEYIHCEECFKAAKEILLLNSKYLCSACIPGFSAVNGQGNPTGRNVPVPIIAGKIGAISSGGEYWEMKELIELLRPMICHPMRIALMCEDGNNIFFNVEPSAGVIAQA